MSQGVKLAILGAGVTGKAHAQGAKEIGGFKIVAAADRIPDRLASLTSQFSIPLAVDDADKLTCDPTIDAVCVCLPTHLHAPVAIAALKSGKHVLIDSPPAPSTKDAHHIAKAAQKSGKVLLYSSIRRFGSAEQSARQAIEKGYAGKIYHARATWLRARGVPRGTGWYHDPILSGGGAAIDLGLPLIDLLMHLLNDTPASVYATTHSTLTQLPVEEAATVIIHFAGGATAEISVAWAGNQPASQIGTSCRLSGETGAIDLYTPQGPTIYRGFTDQGESKSMPMKQPKSAGYLALMRHFKECIAGKATPVTGAETGVAWMQIMDAVYKSAESGKVVRV